MREAVQRLSAPGRECVLRLLGASGGAEEGGEREEAVLAILRDVAGRGESSVDQAAQRIGAIFGSLVARNRALLEDAVLRGGTRGVREDAESVAELRRRVAELEGVAGGAVERAERAEREAEGLRGEVERTKKEAAELRERAERAEGDLESVREAYGMIEAGAFQNEARVQELEERVKVSLGRRARLFCAWMMWDPSPGAQSLRVSPQRGRNRRWCWWEHCCVSCQATAVVTPWAQMAEAGGGADVEEIERRIRAELQEELDSINDLLTCLGQVRPSLGTCFKHVSNSLR